MPVKVAQIVAGDEEPRRHTLLAEAVDGGDDEVGRPEHAEEADNEGDSAARRVHKIVQ